MFVKFNSLVKKGERVAVALSGGMDSMALLHYAHNNAKALGIEVVAINVEHGIRGEASISDTNFVKEYCDKNDIPLFCYAVDSIKVAKEQKLSIEQSARKLRYECFFDAIAKGQCDKIATAHHQSDNAESILFNILRGSGIKGAKGIESNYNDKIIRPMLGVQKADIQEYVKQNHIPFVTDKTNFDDDYTRNFLRLNVIPKIKEIFPEMEQSLTRFAEICSLEDDFMQTLAIKSVELNQANASISLPIERAIFNRSVIIALKSLGVKKDWEKTHIDSVYSLCNKQNGAKISLLDGITAIREYDKITLYQSRETTDTELPFAIGSFDFCNQQLTIKEVAPTSQINLTQGLYLDADKLPKTATIRTPQTGDFFTKFGGGTKKLCDYLTDKKIPQRLRSTLPIIADQNVVYAIFGIGISQNVKVTDQTKNILQII